MRIQATSQIQKSSGNIDYLQFIRPLTVSGFIVQFSKGPYYVTNGEHRFHTDQTGPICLLIYDVYVTILVELTSHLE